MSGTSVIKQLPPKDLRAELRTFIAGASRPSTVNQFELVRKSFSLLRSLPAAKDAVLEYLSTLFDKSVSNYMNELENIARNQTLAQPKEEVVIDELHNSLISFVSSSPPGWALVISKWACDLLGTLSSKYSGRGRAPVNGVLSDSLQQWMSCRATRSLIDVNGHCFMSLVNSENEANCFSTLLDICVQYTPHFDWVVAHVGSCFPTIVIKSVLSWGLKDFSLNDISTRTNKLNSAIGILIHLAGSHLSDIKLAMCNLFQWSLTTNKIVDEKTMHEKMAVLPFLMQLASHSPVLLSALSANTLQCFTPNMFGGLNRFCDQWIKYTGGRQALLDLVVHLILYTEDSAQHIITLLLDATQNPDGGVASIAEEILELLIKELDVSVRVNDAKIPLLECIFKKVTWLLPLLISQNELHVSTAVTILSLIGQQQPSVLSHCVSFILLRSSNDDHLASVVKLTQGYKPSQILTPAIALSLSGYQLKDLNAPYLLWTNMSKLLKWEASGTLTSLPMQEAVWENLIPIAELLYETEDVQIAHSIGEVTKRAVLGSKSQPSVHLIMALVQAAVSYFYSCLIQSRDMEQLKGLRVVNALLGKVSQCSAAARSMAIRELLESALFAAPSVLFGTIPEPGKRLVQPPSSLLKDHHKQGTSMLLGRRLSSVFHAGVIGNGKRKITPTCPVEVNKVVHNTYLFIMALKACCTNENPQGTLDAVISVALLLVELISPDVMYNGLPWPEEDFCKVTVERDLSIRRIFDGMPLLWSLLEYIAYHRPALCYCSVLLRALVATLLGQWSSASQQGREPGQCKSLILTTTRVLQLMALSQLLPPPLNALSDVIPFLPPSQVMLVLRDCVWNYMRDHVPSPALFVRDSNGAMWRDPSTSRPAKQYTETLRLVMQYNISSLGPLYNTLFVHDMHDLDDD